MSVFESELNLLGRGLHSLARKAFLVAGIAAMASVAARAQPLDPLGDILARAQAESATPSAPQGAARPLGGNDDSLFRQAVDSGRRGDVAGARTAIAAMSDPLARKTATWVLVDSNTDALSFFELDNARRELRDWPRMNKRQAATEKQLETAGKSPQQVVDWFAGAEPATAEGAMALASAYRGLGRTAEATDLIRKWWRTKTFEADVQRSMLARFGDVLTQEDHIKRADALLYGSQGPASRDMIALLPADQQQMALARIALRSDASNANDLVAALTPQASATPGVAFERAAYMRRKGLDSLAIGQLQNFPKDIVTPEQAERIWNERYRLVLSSLRNGDARSAYAAADAHLTSGGDAADAEFYAGWIALRKLNDPERAAKHFAALDRIGSSPITQGRALYWLGRAAEAKGDKAAAERYYSRSAENYTTFYGQLAGEKLGRRLTLTPDPVITPEARARFEGREAVQATRLLYNIGQRELFRTFVLNLDDMLPTAEDEAQLVDLARNYGDQDTSMKVARVAAQRGFTLPQRAYPVRTPPLGVDVAEPSLVLGITRQESGFDPLVRSGVGARGMMQLMPTTAAIVARKIGVNYSPGMLDDADYNMRLGSSYLGQLVNQFSGSYVMAIAGYNAGPGRPTQWSSFCGDPRGGSTDPIDFIECIPFSETRNYVMRVMEGMQVYRARLNGGSAPITLSSDLKRGSYSYAGPVQAASTEGR
jgi:soluble lytic murein transglycosylase